MSRMFGIPFVLAHEQVQREALGYPHESKQPLPAPTGKAPYRLALADITHDPADSLSFIVMGDTGGIVDAGPQKNVAAAIAAALAQSTTAFVYHVGDLVYFNGDHAQWFPQFYEPYEAIDVPIVGVPGNHDGDNSDNPAVPSLDAFMANLCAPTVAHQADAQDAPRETMTQPNCYWTLEAALVTIIGLYTNVPSGGIIEPDQAAWLVSELRAAAPDKKLIVALHHPPFSADAHHGGSKAMGAVLDAAFAAAGRFPDLVLSGHVHNYQRFTRQNDATHKTTYVVSGNGGYHNLHGVAGGIGPMPWPVPGTDVQLCAYDDRRWGFTRFTITPGQPIKGEYMYAVASAGIVADMFEA